MPHLRRREDLKLPNPELEVREDCKRLPRMVPVETSAELQDYIEEIRRRAEVRQARMVDRYEENMLQVSCDGGSTALDMPLVDPELGWVAVETKIDAAADLLARVYEEHRDEVFTDPCTGKNTPRGRCRSCSATWAHLWRRGTSPTSWSQS